MASIVYVYPFRCRACLQRFHAFQWGQRYIRTRKERRRTSGGRWISGPRSGSRRVGRRAGCGTCPSGLALETQAELPPGQHLELDLQPGPGERPIRVEVAVVRTIQSGRIGLQFIRVKDESDERLQKFLTGRAGDVPPGSAG